MTGVSVAAIGAAASEAASAADVLVASHRHYPAFRHLFPDEERRSRALRPFFAAAVRDAAAFGWTLAVRRGNEVAGVGVWLPPGAFPWSAARKLRATPSFLKVAGAAPGSFRQFLRYGANAESAHPPDRHWYLVVLGVRPEHQRQGLGSALVEPVLRQADSTGIGCYLETSDPANVEFYGRHGFTVENWALQLVPGGPAHVSMRRKARP